MAFTSSDLTNIETAIKELALGQRVVEIRVAGKVTIYAEADLPRLRELRSVIQTEVGTTVSRTYAKQGGRASY